MGIVRFMFFGWAEMFRFMFVWVRGKFGTGDIQNIFVFKGGGYRSKLDYFEPLKRSQGQ